MSEEKEDFFMNTNKNSTMTLKSNIKLFGNVRVMIIAALFIAMSIVLGKLLAFNIGNSIRISFENLPVLMAGIFFGPVIGAVVGLGADLIGCLIAGYSINPIITLGIVSVGFVSGLLAMLIKTDKLPLRIYPSVLIAHAVGSMVIKSIGLFIYFHTPLPVLLTRIPLYIGTGIVEATIIIFLMSNKAFNAEIEKMLKK